MAAAAVVAQVGWRRRAAAAAAADAEAATVAVAVGPSRYYRSDQSPGLKPSLVE